MPPRLIESPQFLAAVESLRVPQMGTEVIGPLLSLLIQLRRPRRVLEVGMGYTTPFLAAALADLETRGLAEAEALAAKTSPYLAENRPLDEAWVDADPALLAPGFYLEPYHPELVAVDNLSIPDSSAPRVLDVLRDLGLAERVTVVNADLRECRELLPEGFAPIDLAWVDAWECLYFFDRFWDLINPDGGMIVFHYLMTYPEGEAILDYLAKVQRARPGEMEILNLLEPHKLTQNSITVIRRTSAGRSRGYAEAGSGLTLDGPVRAEAEELAARADTAPALSTEGLS